MDKIKQLTTEELIKIAYEHKCAVCMCDIIEYHRSTSGNYWTCNACNKKTCDDCKDTTTDLTEEEAEEMDMNGYICICCRKEAKEEDKSK